MGDRLRARQSIYSCVLSARCCFSVAYIFLHSPPSHMASQWLRNSGGGWMQRVEVEEVEPDGLDSTWAPGDQPRSVLSSSATITGSPAPSPFLWGEETPRPQGISLPLASLLPPPPPPPAACFPGRAKSRRKHAGLGPATYQLCHREQVPVPL